MRFLLKFKPNRSPIKSIYNSDINSFIQKVLGTNNKWHGRFSPYSVSAMHGGKLQSDGTIQYPNGGYLIISSDNETFTSNFMFGLMRANRTYTVATMPFDSFKVYNANIMSDYSIFHLENVLLPKNKLGEKKDFYTFNDEGINYLDLLLEHSIKKLINNGISEEDAKSLKFESFHPEGWKKTFPKYKVLNGIELSHPTSTISLIVRGSVEARRALSNLGFGNSTGYGFGAVCIKEDKKNYES